MATIKKPKAKLTSPTTSHGIKLSRHKLWETKSKSLPHPHKITGMMRTITICYKLPVKTQCLESLVVNGTLVYDYAGLPTRTAPIGGGGRFELRRRYYDGECVSCELLIRDLTYYTSKRPTVSGIIGVLP